MTKEEALARLERMIDEVKVGILASCGAEGYPRLRWMTPALVRGRGKAVFALTRGEFAKVEEVKLRPQVEWMFQRPALDRILTVRGKINVVDNPSLRAEVLEVVGPRLRAFWKLAPDERDLLVLETVIEAITIYDSLSGSKESVHFPEQGGR